MSQVVFVYAVDGGIVNSLMNFTHKLISPRTYSCNLCALTSDMLGNKREWARFIQELGVATEFLHRNEFAARYPGAQYSFPTVFLSTENTDLKVLITSSELSACHNLAGLISLVRERVKPVSENNSHGILSRE